LFINIYNLNLDIYNNNISKMKAIIIICVLISLYGCSRLKQDCDERLQPVFRWLRSGDKFDSFYTISSNGGSAPSSGYKLDGTKFYTIRKQGPLSVPIFRLSKEDSHVYTDNPDEKQKYIDMGYADQGNIGYGLKSTHPNSVPLYKFYNSSTKRYFFTTDAGAESLEGWENQGTAANVLPQC
jgi:hypothetical protein